MTQILPAIDIIDGKCVRLTKGDYESKKVYDASPVDMAMRYADCGVKRIHLVDLDGAKCSSPANLRTLEKITAKVDTELEWGGGIASGDNLRSVFSAGAGKAIIGSVAALSPELFSEWLAEYGDALILGADVRGRKIAVKGWREEAQLGIDELLTRFGGGGLRECICTDIMRDGMLEGPSFALYESLQRDFPGMEFTVSGGISSMRDIEKVRDMGLPRVIVGKAVYENRISLEDIESFMRGEARGC